LTHASNWHYKTIVNVFLIFNSQGWVIQGTSIVLCLYTLISYSHIDIINYVCLL
jgi:hypothetical protein